MTTNRQIRIVAMPADKLSPEHFELSEGTAPEPGPGEVLCKVF